MNTRFIKIQSGRGLYREFWHLIIFIIVLIFSEIKLYASPYFNTINCSNCDAAGIHYICSGTSLTFYAICGVTAGTYTYQWQYWNDMLCNDPPYCHIIGGWSNVSGGTNKDLTATTTERYRCFVTNNNPILGYLEWYTGEVDVRVSTSSPGIAGGGQPVDQNPCLGNGVSYSVSASGNFNQYQWYEVLPGGSTTLITGATSTSYSFTPTSSQDMYKYKCTVTNGCGSVTTREALLNITIPPDVTSNPVSSTICQEGSTSFSISTTGDVSSYSWEYSGDNYYYYTVPNQAPFSGLGTYQLALSNTGTNWNGYYFRCKVTNNCSVSDYSAGAQLGVQTKLTVSNAPSGNYYVCDGSNASFSVNYSGTAPISIQWQEYVSGWGNIAGQTSSSLNFPAYLNMNNRQYRAILTQSNTCNTSYTTTSGTLLVNALPKVESQPQSQQKCQGENASFSISGSGAGVNYQWQVSTNAGMDWSNLANEGQYMGVLTSDLTVSNIQENINGYLFRCLVGGTCQPVQTSSQVALTVKSPPSIFTHPASASKCIGDSNTFSVIATGTEPLYYQWGTTSGPLTGWISDSSFTINSISLADAGAYIVKVKNECNPEGTQSYEANLIVNSLPSVNLGNDRHFCPGNPTELNAGAGHESYLWNTTATTQKIDVAEEGSYFVTVTNLAGCEGSDTINVIMDPSLPELDLGPETIRLCQGEAITLDGTDQFDSYSWNTGSFAQQINVSKSGIYYVTTSRYNSVCTKADTMHVFVATPYDKDQICLVTVDLLTGNNLIVWEKTPGAGIVEYHIWRETSKTNVYKQIGTVMVDGLSIFKDNEADPEKQAYVYKITAVDTCENESLIASSVYHKPLFLQYISSEGGVQLRWDRYELGKDSISFVTYEIYRGSDSTSLSLLDEVSTKTQSYTDNDPNALKYRYYYRVAGVKEDPCYPSGSIKADTGPYSHSMSNIEDNRLKVVEGINLKSAEALIIYPNPFSDYTTIRFTNPEQSEYRLVVRDLSRKIVMIMDNITGEEVLIKRSNMKAGYYMVEVIGQKIFRGKFIIE